MEKGKTSKPFGIKYLKTSTIISCKNEISSLLYYLAKGKKKSWLKIFIL